MFHLTTISSCDNSHNIHCFSELSNKTVVRSVLKVGTVPDSYFLPAFEKAFIEDLLWVMFFFFFVFVFVFFIKKKEKLATCNVPQGVFAIILATLITLSIRK